ncbi:MAG TPA: alpha/beta fold hydrolase [Gaiellaceae bacterium]
MVLIHAGICDSRMWDPQWETFRPSHRVLRYDMRGFGRSPVGPDSYSNAGDLIDLLEQQGVAKASLVGVSMGGRVALEVAIARPELVDALVLVGAGFPGHDWSAEMNAADEAEMAALKRGDLDAAVEVALRTWVDGPRRRPEDVDSDVRARVAEMQRRAYELQLPVWETAEEEPLVGDLSERVGEVDAPTLVLVGEEDVRDMHEIAGRLERELPNARRASIANTAHVPSMERPREFDQLVLPFLQSVQ